MRPKSTRIWLEVMMKVANPAAVVRLESKDAFPDFLDHSLQSFDFVAVPHIFGMIFIDHVDTVGNTDYNEQRW